MKGYPAKLILSILMVLASLVFAEDTKYSWKAVSRNKLFYVTLYPKKGDVPIGKFHEWIILVHDSKGNPVYPVHIGVGGGMPGHGHGLPSQPVVTEYLGDGKYLIEGMKFSMVGDWILLLGIESNKSRDQVTIEIKVDY